MQVVGADQVFDADDARLLDLAFDGDGGEWDVIIHYDPCRPRHCAGCKMEPCSVRSAAFDDRVPFTLLGATREDESLDDGAPLRPTA